MCGFFVRPFLPAAILSVSVSMFMACAQDPSSGELVDVDDQEDMAIRCVSNEYYDQALGYCVPIFERADLGDGDNGVAMNTEVMTSGEGQDPDCVHMMVYIDKDSDGVGVDDPATNTTKCLTADGVSPGYARVAGDCDDNNRFRSPERIELCDDIDNNCKDGVNDGLICEFYAQTASKLYVIDPFKKTAVELADVPGLVDMDTHPDGRLYGITYEKLYRFDPNVKTWITVGAFNASVTSGINGLAINRGGKAFATANNKLFDINLNTGRATLIGTMNNDVYSSGDCVINKADLLMTSRSRVDGEPDTLVSLNMGDASSTLVGSTGFSRVYALTTAWSRLYGLTSSGELIKINRATGAAELVHKFQGLAWYGAASTPVGDR